MKECKLCGTDYPTTFYYKAKGNKDGLDTTCKECRSEQKRAYSLSNQRRARQYSINVETLNLMLKKGCEICGSHERLCIDHDHSCCPKNSVTCGQCVRGILCDPCNKAIGIMEDNIENLMRAVKYLQKNKVRNDG